MYRVLIVDDEDFVVDSLSDMLESRSEPELDVCCAYSAAEAIGWLDRAKIDIVITDIQMPEMSGIALAEKVRLNWPQCKIIFLTAHAEFDYAYKAIKNNVVGYILKTEEDECILAEVDKAIMLLDKEMKNFELLGQVQDQLKSSMSVIRKEITLSILKEDCDNPLELFEQLKNIGSGILAEKPFIMFTGRIENGLSGFNIVERFRKFSSVEKTVAKYFDEYFYCDSVEYSFNKIVWLVQLKNDKFSKSEESAAIAGHETVFVAGMLETVQQSCMDTCGICISFILHGALLDASRLPKNFQSMDLLMNLHATTSDGFIITDTAPVASITDEVFFEASYPGEQETRNISEKLKTCLENSMYAEYMAELEKITLRFEKCTSWHSNAAMESYFSVAVTIMAFINQRKLIGKIAFRGGINGLFQPQSTGSWRNAAEYLRHISEILFELQREDDGRLSNNIIHFLRQYICEHIAEDISLVRLSEVSGYNTKYLSRLFRESTSETLNDFICRQKINRIKELMNNKSLSISDIASQAGFEYRTYFNRFIRKNTGLSPREFREHLLRG